MLGVGVKKVHVAKKVVCWPLFCLGEAGQIHAVESPRAETEPVVVFLIPLCSHSHSLTALWASCKRTTLPVGREK